MIKQPQQASTRVALNTGILYAKMLITMGITLYSTRLVLNALGASDYGIFNLIAGVIAMLSFLNAAMTVSTQRYLSFHQGTGDFEMQKRIFTNSWVLHISIGFVLVALLLVLVPFLLDGLLNIPADRISVAKAIYYFMLVSVFFTIISVPFTASLNAHENMLWISIVSVIESVIKLAIAFSLFWFIQSERLVVYSILMAALSLTIFLFYAVYCLKKYSECKVKNYQIDKSLIKELTAFAGWNSFAAFGVVCKTQAIAVVLNIFLGTIANAAYGIAGQISGQLMFLSQTMLRALNPQIMKSEGMNDRKRMLRLSMMASKFGFFLVAIIAIPCIFEMSAILKFWLKNLPDYTVMFCSLTLIGRLMAQTTVGLQSAAQSIGKIRNYQLSVSIILLSVLPVAYFLLQSGYSAYCVLWGYIAVELLASIFRLFYLKKLAGLSIKEYFDRVIFKAIMPLLISVLICRIMTTYFSLDYRFIFTIMVSAIIFMVSIYFTGLCADEKKIVNTMLRKIKKVILKDEERL